jgi:hypothetical protein
MKPEGWQQLDELFRAALERQSHERAVRERITGIEVSTGSGSDPVLIERHAKRTHH